MAKKQAVETGWRGSEEGWLDAAYEALIENGVDSVRILPLAKQLKLSRTSFYWFFDDREALLEALLDRWRSKNTRGFVARAGAYAETITEAVLNVFDCWLDPRLFDARLEVAVRNWAQQSTDVSQEIEAADGARLAALRGMFQRFDYAELSADVRARTIYLTQMGYISMQTVETDATRIARMPTYVEIFTGVAAPAREIARFTARHSADGVVT